MWSSKSADPYQFTECNIVEFNHRLDETHWLSLELMSFRRANSLKERKGDQPEGISSSLIGCSDRYNNDPRERREEELACDISMILLIFENMDLTK